jgi:asparagine N-glycosylation enzyme membrane subunit Stt3
MIPIRKKGEDEREDRYLKLRNLLNTIFMLGALIGVCIYAWGNSTIGTIIILVSMLFKMVECVYRFRK